MVEVTSYPSPCKIIRRSFANRRLPRISQITNPGWSRVYRRFLAAGLVKIGGLVGIFGEWLAQSLPLILVFGAIMPPLMQEFAL